jgi:hypothetical protein
MEPQPKLALLGSGIFHFEHEGGPVLGLDTGLSAEAFARARLASLVTEPGYIVSFQTAGIEPWRIGGVTELLVNGRTKPVVVIRGPDFAGRTLDEIIMDSNTAPGNALNALAAWVRARLALPPEGRTLPPWPGAALIDGAAETVLFLPEAPVRRVFDADGGETRINGAERWTHPDYSGEEAGVFAAAALLYRALSGRLPYPNRDRNVLRQDIREGVFIPPALAAPGLRDEPASLISAALLPRSKFKGRRPALADFERVIAAGNAGGFFNSITVEERSKLEAERKRFLQRREKTVKTRRFLSRNRTVLLAVLGAAVIAAFAAGSLIRARLDRPSTRGMESARVIETYYNAFNSLDHTLMEACVTGGAGKDDINMVTNLYVLSMVRQAYEARIAVISPDEWRESGGGPSEKAVFGTSDLVLTETITDENGGLRFRVEYRFFSPYPDNDSDTAAPQKVPAGIPRADELTLVKDKKGLWHIAEIRRSGR